MRVLELSLRNYRVFEEVDLELPAQVIGIFGENGSGKSTLMESIAVALYGVGAARTKKQEIRTHGLLTDCEVRLLFEHAGRQHEVRRALKGRGHTPEAELYGGGLLLASGVTEVDGEIQRLLHMDLGVFRASVYAEQKQLDAFSDLRRGERKEMALRLLGIRPVDEARAVARRESRAARDGAAQLAGAIPDVAALEAALKEAKEIATESARRAKAAAKELNAAASAETAAKEAFAMIDAARQRVETITVQFRAKTEERTALVEQRDALTERIDRLAATLAELPLLEEELAALGDVQERLRAAARFADAATTLAAALAQLEAAPAVDPDAALAEVRSAEQEQSHTRISAAQTQAEHGQRARLLAEAEDRLARATGADPDQPCPTCGRPLGEDFTGYVRHCKSAVAEAKRAATAAMKAAKAAASELAAAEKRLEAAAERGEEARSVNERRTRLAEQVAGLEVDVAALAEQFGGEAPDPEVLREQASRTDAIVKRIAEIGADRRHLEHAEHDRAARAARIATLEAELQVLTDEAEAAEFDPDRHSELREAQEEAIVALGEAREAERRAGDARRDAETAAAELTGQLGQARETAAKVDHLRSESRYTERVGMLLDGFRDHLVARVGPELSREAEALFRELTNHEYDDLRVNEETLAIEIADGDAYFPVERFSGSETDLANLALRVAISTHLSRVSGADIGMVVLDEALGALDRERKDLMVRAMGRLADRLHQLFVVTHAEQVKDQFPASVHVAKSSRRRSTATLL